MAKRSLGFLKTTCAGEARERTHLACCSRHLAGNFSQRVPSRGAAKHTCHIASVDMEALKVLGGKADVVGLPT